MAQPCYKASAPGSLILMGEYAVLHDFPAIVVAIDKTISVTITPRSDQKIQIHSALGEYACNLNNITIEAPLEYVLATLLHFTPLKSGLDIKIEAKFCSKMGLGSSAAVTVALLTALNQWQQKNQTPEDLFHDALSIILSVQGKGSGADIAASIFGGIIEFNADPLKIKSLQVKPPIVVVYSGQKTTTTEALKTMSARLTDEPNFINDLINKLGKLSLEALAAINASDWPLLGKLMNQAQLQLKTLDVSTANIDNIVEKLQQQKTIYGAKISGSGLGDCVIGLGELNQPLFADNQLALSISQQGVVKC